MPIKTLTSQEATLLTHPYKWHTTGWLSPSGAAAMEQADLSSTDGWSVTGPANQPFEFIVYNSSTTHVITVYSKTGAAGGSSDYTSNNPWCAILPRETAHFIIEPNVSIGLFHENSGTQTISAYLRYSNCIGAPVV